MAPQNADIYVIFNESVERKTDDDRVKYLNEACKGNSTMRQEVESLLRAHLGAGNFLGGESPQIAPTIETGPAGEQPGTIIGPYELVEEIGEGGMGSVFMALQKKPVRRTVALKVIKPGMDSKQVVSRFEAERQALALMDHPNIAKVHDGGTTESGRPYFVMELVKGIPITDYCDGHRLTNNERVALFCDVCSAVHHAHQKGIIHRDLKPSNVLVTQLDGKPLPKIIDFGIAKATSGHLMDESFVTGFSQLVGTPMYMSPEQAELTATDVDTRSDVYSLGVLLYELLTGVTPFDRDRMSSVSFDEVRRIIREEDPPRPSTRLSTLDAALETVAENRHTDTRSLSNDVSGELDWIVMKALEKDRVRRYESASDFARDIHRYLNHEPVEACPPSKTYRLRKFAQRNKRTLTVTVIALAGMVALLVGTTLTAISQRQSARRQLRIQSGIHDALDEVTQLRRQAHSDPIAAPSALARASEQVQLASALAEAGPAEPQLVTQVRQLASELADEQRDRQLLTALDKAWLAQAETNVPESRLDYGACIPLLKDALCAYGLTAGEASPTAAAEKIRSRPRAIRQQLLAALEEWKARSPRNIGINLRKVDGATIVQRVIPGSSAARDGRLKTGDQIMGIGEGQSGAILDVLDMKPQEIWNLLASKSTDTVRLKVKSREATDVKTYEIQRDPIPQWIAAVIELADEDPWRRRWRETLAVTDNEKQLLALVSLVEEIDLGQQPVRVLTSVAERLDKLGATDRAARLLRRVMRMYPSDVRAYISSVRLSGTSPNDAVRYYSVAVALRPDSAGLRVNLANSLSLLGELEEAVGEYHEALRLAPDDGGAHFDLGCAYLRLEKLDEAIAACREAIRYEPGHADAYYVLADALRARDKQDEAIIAYRETVRLNPSFPGAHNALGNLLQLRGEFDEAIEEFRAAIRLQPNAAVAHHNLGNALRLRGKMEEAENAFRKAIELEDDAATHHKLGLLFAAQQRWGDSISEFRAAVKLEPEAAHWHNDLGNALLENRMFEQAVHHFRKAIELEPEYALAHSNLGCTLQQQGQLEAAVVEYRKAIEFDPTCPQALNNLAWVLATSVDTQEHDPVEAVELASKAVQQAPGVGVAWHTLGVAYYRNGDWKNAKKAIEKAMARGLGGTASEWLLLAMAHWQLGDKGEARRWFDKSVAWMAENMDHDSIRETVRFRIEAAELLGIAESIQDESTKERSEQQ